MTAPEPLGFMSVVYEIDGTRTPGEIRLEKPAATSNGFVCGGWLKGLNDRPTEGRGETALAAAQDVLKKLAAEAVAFEARGGRLLAPDQGFPVKGAEIESL